MGREVWILLFTRCGKKNFLDMEKENNDEMTRL